VVVRKYASSVEAQVAQLVLEAHGIPSLLLRDDAGGMIPAMHILFPARLAVRRDHAEEARRVLDAEPAPPSPASDAHDDRDADDDDDDPDVEPWRR
jgi:hypothetical protein